MYKIIGSNGKTYGPIGVEKIREWIAQGRVDARTAAITEGGMEWTFLGLLPEFARELASPPPVITSPNPVMAAANNTNGFATAGFVCGLISLTCCCGCPFNILGLIFSTVALLQIHGQTQKQQGWGLALAGLICSTVSLLVSFGLVIFQLALTPANAHLHFGPI